MMAANPFDSFLEIFSTLQILAENQRRDEILDDVPGGDGGLVVVTRVMGRDTFAVASEPFRLQGDDYAFAIRFAPKGRFKRRNQRHGDVVECEGVDFHKSSINQYIISAISMPTCFYGYTHEFSGDSTQLLYLRSRYYASNTGRFLTRDTWGGNANMPMSFNRWNYGYGNPVKYTDPSGHFPTFCQSMPTKGLYELCVLGNYGLEPISYLELGERVQGSQGCYSGPSEYRAPGYIEGYQFGIAVPTFVSITYAYESVYDFARMEQHNFSVGLSDPLRDVGVVLSDLGVGISASEYAGVVYGLKSSLSLREAYKGEAIQLTRGVGVPIIGAAGAGVGKSSFVSTTDLMVRGTTWYIGLSLGEDVLPIYDLGISLHMNYVPSGSGDNYLTTDKRGIDEIRLYSDILYGRHNVWPIGSNPILGDIPFDWAARSLGYVLAQRYVHAYKELHFDENK